MSKYQKLLDVYKKHVGEWLCINCACNEAGINSSQAAKLMQSMRNNGYRFEEPSKGRWSKQIPCLKCKYKNDNIDFPNKKELSSHYKLLSINPSECTERCGLTKSEINRVKNLLGNVDAISGNSCILEVDHKTPRIRMCETKKVSEMSDNEIIEKFQLLTSDENKLKDKHCTFCKKYGIRPPFNRLPFYSSGNALYNGTCEGCGWHDCKRLINDISNGIAIIDTKMKYCICDDSQKTKNKIKNMYMKDISNYQYSSNTDINISQYENDDISLW